MKQATHFNVQPGWKILISDMRLNPAHVLALAELPADLFSRKDAKLTASEYFRLWHCLEQPAGVEELPLKNGHNGRIPRSLGAVELVFFTQIARLATRKRIEPVDLVLPILPEHPQPYTSFFGKSIRSGKVIRMAFSAQDAVCPFLTENSAM